MRQRIVWLGTCVVLLCGTAGCRKSEDGSGGSEQTVADRVKQQAGQAMDSAGQFAGQTKEQVLAAAQDQLDQLRQKYEQWKQQTTVDEQAKAKLSELQATFEAHLKTASESLGKAKAAGTDAWSSTASTVQEALTKAQSTFDQLVSYVKTQGQTTPPTE